jgi:tetratricopeptide (TPR) repeat protein
LAREPDSILGLTELINVELAMDNVDGAISRLQGILESNPDHRAAHDLLGIAYMNKQDFAAAEAEFQKQLAINPDSSVVYAQIAQARIRQGNQGRAVEVYQQGLGRLPNDTRLLAGLAGLYLRQGDLHNAAETYQKGLEHAPDNPQFVLGFAGVREREGRYEEAISTYEQFLEKQPDNILATNNLAALLSDHRDDEASLARARELAGKLRTSDQAPLLDTLGWVHYRVGEYDPAVEVLTRVVEKAPEVPVFNYHLGMALYKQGNAEAAKTYLSKAVDGTHTYDGVEEARRVLEELSQ